MEVKNLSADELRSFDVDRRKDLEKEIKRELVTSRMDVYTPTSQNASKVKTLRKNLARLLTIAREDKNSSKKLN